MSDAPRLDHVQCLDNRGLHRMAYWEWGDAANPRVLVCAHGLTRQGRDFDVLAQGLLSRAAQPLRIVCPDVAGRGRSDWLADPMGYQIPNYVADMVVLDIPLLFETGGHANVHAVVVVSAATVTDTVSVTAGSASTSGTAVGSTATVGSTGASTASTAVGSAAVELAPQAARPTAMSNRIPTKSATSAPMSSQ